jgi:hypothetical protein
MSNTLVALAKPKNGKRLSFNLESRCLTYNRPVLKIVDIRIPKHLYSQIRDIAIAYLKGQYAIGTVEVKLILWHRR